MEVDKSVILHISQTTLCLQALETLHSNMQKDIKIMLETQEQLTGLICYIRKSIE